MNLIRRLALFCGILTLLAFARISLGDVLATAEWLATNGLQRTHLPHARAASSACEYAFAGEIAQPQAELCPSEVAPTSIAAPRIARVGAGSHLGTPRDLLGSDGTVRWSAAYTAWGKIYEECSATNSTRGPPAAGTIEDDAIRSPFRLLGQYYDEETGLAATRFRMWEAETGRWLSPDPLGIAGGENQLGFGGVPSVDIDPLGLKCTTGIRGERIARKYLKTLGFTNIQSVQNKSGHGIDLVARDRNGNLHFFEVKTTVGSTPPRLSVAQQNSSNFIGTRLDRAAGGSSAWRSTAIHDPNAAAKAAELRKEIGTTTPQASVIRVTLDEGTPNASDIAIDPW
jgi:RHS repeat-associated protein